MGDPNNMQQVQNVNGPNAGGGNAPPIKPGMGGGMNFPDNRIGPRPPSSGGQRPPPWMLQQQMQRMMGGRPQRPGGGMPSRPGREDTFAGGGWPQGFDESGNWGGGGGGGPMMPRFRNGMGGGFPSMGVGGGGRTWSDIPPWMRGDPTMRMTGGGNGPNAGGGYRMGGPGSSGFNEPYYDRDGNFVAPMGRG